LENQGFRVFWSKEFHFQSLYFFPSWNRYFEKRNIYDYDCKGYSFEKNDHDDKLNFNPKKPFITKYYEGAPLSLKLINEIYW